MRAVSGGGQEFKSRRVWAVWVATRHSSCKAGGRQEVVRQAGRQDALQLWPIAEAHPARDLGMGPPPAERREGGREGGRREDVDSRRL